MNKEYDYMVSVYMTTYFHEKYVSQAIDSILSQNVNFKYEIIISDDCSNDATQSIIKAYQEKYDFIKVNINSTNIGLSENMFLAKSLCKGKYIIPLSGDDFWIDQNKLQKQVDFLESHYEYIGIATRIEARSEDNSKVYYALPDLKDCNKVLTIRDYIKGKNFPTNGMLMRNVISENYQLFSSMPKISKYIDDNTDSMFILTLGNIYISDDVTVAYRLRIAKKGEHNFNSINTGFDKFKKNIMLLNNLDEYFHGEYDLINRYKRVIAPVLIKYYRKNSKKEFDAIINSIPKKYHERKLLIRCILYIPVKIYEIIRRKVIGRRYKK